MLRHLVFVGVIGLFAAVWMNAPASRAATATVTQTCSAAAPGAVTITLAWPAPGSGAQQTWFDISLTPGFAPGWFQGHGPLATSQRAFAFDAVPSGLNFYYRVNTLYNGGAWKESAVGSFVSNCNGGGGSAGPPAAGNVAQVCDGGGSVTATFNWKPGAAGQQWLDLSTKNNGFAPGTFVGAGPVGSGGGAFTWTGISRGVTHYWRVNVLSSGGWMSSNTGSFTSVTCEPPMRACIGWMKGYTQTGRAECDVILAGPDRVLADCLARALKLPYTEKYACGQVKAEPFLKDCLMSFFAGVQFGGQSCRNYYY